MTETTGGFSVQMLAHCKKIHQGATAVACRTRPQAPRRDPKKLFRDPKWGRDPKVGNRWARGLIFFLSLLKIFVIKPTNQNLRPSLPILAIIFQKTPAFRGVTVIFPLKGAGASLLPLTDNFFVIDLWRILETVKFYKLQHACRLL